MVEQYLGPNGSLPPPPPSGLLPMMVKGTWHVNESPARVVLIGYMYEFCDLHFNVQ